MQPITINHTVTITIDPTAWALEYGLDTAAAAPADVESWLSGVDLAEQLGAALPNLKGLATIVARRVQPPVPTSPGVYTVVGLVDNSTSPRTLTVAGVIAGEHNMADTDTNDEDQQRWSESFTAYDAAEAEESAHEAVESDDDEDDDEIGPITVTQDWPTGARHG